MKARKLPKIDSIQELARFWDQHDLTAFKDEIEDVNEPVFDRKVVIPLRLESPEADAIRRIAKAKGVSDEQVVREWVFEKIRAG